MYSEYNYNDTLCHYGVKGMKWGVRRENKRKAKLNAYRQKLENKSKRKSDSHKNNANAYKRDFTDIKKYGLKSKVYQEHVKDQYDFDSAFTSPGTIDSVMNLGKVIYRANSTSYMNEYVSDLKDSYNKEIKKGKEWNNRSNALKNMKIDKYTRKSDIRRVYRGK